MSLFLDFYLLRLYKVLSYTCLILFFTPPTPFLTLFSSLSTLFLLAFLNRNDNSHF